MPERYPPSVSSPSGPLWKRPVSSRANMPGMNVVFVEPFFPSNQRHFARALAEVGATVLGVGESPAEALDEQLKGWLHNYEQVPSVTDVEAMTRQVRSAQDRLWV